MFKNGIVFTALILFASVFGALDSRAQTATGRVIIEPVQKTYYTGQKARLVLVLDLIDLEMSSDIRIQSLPSGFMDFSEFYPLPTASSAEEGKLKNTLRFASDVTFIRKGEFSAAPKLSGSFFENQQGGGFMGGFRVVKSLAIVPDPLPVSVSPLPEPRPKDFTGAVGQFKLTAAMSPANASPGDIVTLKWQLDGFGTIDDFKAPEYNPGGSYRNYPAKEEFREKDKRIGFIQTFVPASVNAAPPPPLSMSVFDPVEGAYFSLFSDPFELKITEAKAPEVPQKPAQPAWTPASSPAVSQSAEQSGARTFTVTADSVKPLLVPLCGIMLAVILFAWLFTTSKWLASAAAIAVIAASFGLHEMLSSRYEESIHILPSPAGARLCPSSESKPEFEIPANAKLRILEKTDRWIRVEWNGVSAWIPASALN